LRFWLNTKYLKIPHWLSGSGFGRTQAGLVLGCGDLGGDIIEVIHRKCLAKRMVLFTTTVIT
jgi:hypothetical protein